MRNAFVTGGSRGIGLSIATHLLESGYHVFLNIRQTNQDILDLTVRFPHQLELVIFDLQNVAQMEQAISSMQSTPIDLLINNAGILKDNLLPSVEDADWDNILEVNFWSLVRLYQKIEQNLLLSQNPVVISMGSISGVRPRAGQGPYAVSKAMVIEWSRSMAEHQKKIRFFAISPGPVATDMIKKAPWYTQPEAFSRIPMKRFAEPEEIAHCARMLHQSYDLIHSGTNIVIDGGFIQTTKGS